MTSATSATSATVEFRPTSPNHPARRPLLIAMLVYSLGFVGAAAIVWHEAQRVRSARWNTYARSSDGRIAGVIGREVGAVHWRTRTAR